VFLDGSQKVKTRETISQKTTGMPEQLPISFYSRKLFDMFSWQVF
jgi:hypothetical protein